MSLTTNPEDPCIRETRPDGQQECYLVLSEPERAKGFVRPVRTTYIHVGINPTFYENSHTVSKVGSGGCLGRTVMGIAIAETYARDPKFYGATFCVNCGKHLPVNEFIWEGTNELVGS